jgi:3-deoxy-7-phosphoheptulonate synthase
MQARAFTEVVNQRVSGNTQIIGCMVESNINPGSQKMGASPSDLQYGVSITDACIGWEETVELLTWAHERVAATAKVPIN